MRKQYADDYNTLNMSEATRIPDRKEKQSNKKTGVRKDGRKLGPWKSVHGSVSEKTRERENWGQLKQIRKDQNPISRPKENVGGRLVTEQICTPTKDGISVKKH